MPDLALLVVLAAFVIVDCATRSLPLGVLAPAALMLGAGYWLQLWPVSLFAVAVPFLGALLGGLPGGDQKALALLGGMLGPFGALWMTVLLLALTFVLVETVGRRYSVIGLPWMPVVSAVVLVVRIAAKYHGNT